MRYLFVIGDVFVQAGAGSPAPALLSPNQAFTVWNALSGGTQITDLTAVDGVSALTTDVLTGNPVADGAGVPPPFRGPDGFIGALYIDAGGARFPVFPVEGLVLAIYNAVNNIGGTGGGGTATSIASTGITDSTAVGRSLITAPAAVDARTAIGAGTYTAPAVVAAGATASAARTAIGFDAAVYSLRPLHFMQWNNSTNTWWGYDPVTNAMVSGQARPSVPQGMVWYDCQHDAAATYPTGAQAPIRTNLNMPGDKVLAHPNSPFYT